MLILGSRNLPYLWHSRSSMRPLGSFPGKDDRKSVDCHMKEWGMWAALDKVGSVPLISEGAEMVVKGADWVVEGV